ncbi:SigE family RNA polymerase sigma factor [Phycicoccus flavus]|uniref:SigE family RNA polymerase sigma factor n=1 Tax=Phycicoccus flavus TaxID=2502783 RepID=UPI000FEB6FB1|nr:SigE family RNA polymerase sigma factor [Phycicoccus flavus]NHA69556.1 SigE family RNA polymerase sigma factor [Phycicoccus flavus]
MGEDAEHGEFAAYVRARQRRFVRFAFLLTGDVHEAEDLVQSAFARVYRRWDSIHGSPDAYVRAAIVNEHRSWWRRTWRHREVVSSPLVGARDPEHVPDERDDALWRQVLALPRQQRAVLVLRFYEDLSEARTAEVLGCSVGTVKSHTSRALAALRGSMQEVER